MRETIYSKTIYHGGTFNSQDQVLITDPWEAVAIEIVGAEIAFFQGQPNYAFLGSNFTPDVLLMLGRGDSRASHFYPAGVAFPFPAAGGATPPHISFHVSGQDGAPFQAFGNVYYVKA